MNLLPHMAARLFGAPLMIHRPKLEVILAVLGPRIGLPQAAVPIDAVPDRVTPTGATGIVVLPVYGTLVRRTVGLEAESGHLVAHQVAPDHAVREAFLIWLVDDPARTREVGVT